LAAFCAVFHFGVGHGLPLHVTRPVSAARAQRLDVIDDVAGAFAASQVRGWAGVSALEGQYGSGRAGCFGFCECIVQACDCYKRYS
jgi:hypothetical protein